MTAPVKPSPNSMAVAGSGVATGGGTDRIDTNASEGLAM